MPDDAIELAQPDAAVEDPALAMLRRIAARPHEFGFHQAMRRLEALHADRPRFGRSVRPAQDPLRLAQDPSVVFASATLAAWEQRADLPARLLINCFGLFGPDGPLPLHLTEYAQNRRRNFRDPTFQRFADLFHHRLISLFYRAWADSRPTVSFDRPKDDRFATYVGSLIGLGMESFRERDAMPDLTKLHFAGRLANQTRNAEGLAAILSSFFTMKVRTHCFIGAWLTLPDRDRTLVGTDPRNATLGQSVLAGGRVWSRQHKFRLVFGPLSLAEYLRLLPGGTSFHRLIPIVRNYAGDTLIWDVNLVLKHAEVPKTVLGKQGRLGWTTWLMPRRRQADANDLYLNASADSMAQRIDAQTQKSEAEHVA